LSDSGSCDHDVEFDHGSENHYDETRRPNDDAPGFGHLRAQDDDNQAGRANDDPSGTVNDGAEDDHNRQEVMRSVIA
jgi:hypothetical protein